MSLVPANKTGRSSYTASLKLRYFVAGVFACLGAISALAQTEEIVVTLLPLYAHTTDPDAQSKNT